MFSRISNLFRRSYDPVKPGRRGRDIGEVVAKTLEGRWPAGFQRVHDLTWVSESDNHIRRIFEFQAMKGVTFSACWGISIEFVPLTGRKGLAWKRTAKTAACDLTIDPIDVSGSIPDWCSFFHNDDDRRIQKVARVSLEAAKADWAKLNSLSEIVACFESRSQMTFERFSLENYTQTHLAWGLALIALGRAAEGQKHLEDYAERTGIAPDHPILAKATAIAGKTARTT